MKKANALLLLALFASLAFPSCESPNSKKNNLTPLNKGVTITNPITYEVLIKNPDIDDEWQSKCLENTDVKLMSRDIIGAVINGKLKAFDYYDNHQLSKSEIEAILKKNGDENHIGNIQFKEEWYWDKSSFQLQKKVKSIMFGYEIREENNKVRGYRASFVVNLGNE
ncbi:hypothetical protein [Ancylomarina sp. 16SWW S1-10-2]|uniref:hypothetical protein n=1 Tax=Ancylomarina sp. 16SWW S1-10-2 TaxID=2499681 RepID=UPI0012AD63E7|nr:hypothetical protein [Ancylomarina sp. 16SWW S1-10-2]MRT91565.1 hypothetical protein [Ancylomarina sp. 16SWW S1-10-2]